MGNNLKAARKAANLTQKKAAEKSGIPLGTLRRWEQGVNEPDTESIVKLAALYGTTTDTILGSQFADDIPGSVKIMPASKCAPVCGRIAAGTPMEAIPNSDEYWWVPDPLWESHPKAFYLKVSGDSMNMLFPDGSLVLVDPEEKVSSGDIAVIFVNGDDATVKRIYFAGDTVVLHPESSNPVHKDRPIDSTDPDSPDVRILGKVVSYTAPVDWRP